MQNDISNSVLLVIPSINGGDLLDRMLPSLRVDPANVIVLDQGSDDSTLKVCAKAGVEVLQLGEPHTYTQACNIGARIAAERKKSFVCVSNNDIVFRTNVIAELLAEMQRDDRLGIVAPAQIIVDASLPNQPISYRVFWNLDKVDFYHDVHAHDPAVERLEADFCELTCALIRLSAVEEIGCLDDEYGFYHEDADFGFRLRQAGYSCAYLPHSQIEHFTGSTINREKLSRKTSFIAKNKRYFSEKLLGYGVNHQADDIGFDPAWSAINANLHPYLLRYGLIDPSAPEMLVSLPGAQTTGYLYTPLEAPSIPENWAATAQAYQGVFSTSDWMRDIFQRAGVVNSFRVPLGVEVDHFNPFGPVRRLCDETTYLVTAGREQSRSLRAMLLAWHQFVGSERRARLILLGHELIDCVGRAPDATYRTSKFQILRYIPEAIDVYEIIAPLEVDELARLYRSIDFTVFPSCGDSSILPVLESLACGTPVIHGSFGSMRELSLPGGLYFGLSSAAGVQSSRTGWEPDAHEILTQLHESHGMSAQKRASLAQAGYYLIRNGFTLRHSAVAIGKALSSLQTRNPARFLEHLTAAGLASSQAIGWSADLQRQISRQRISGALARKVQTVGQLTYQIGSVWEENGMKAAGHKVAQQVGFFARHKCRQATYMGLKSVGRLGSFATNFRRQSEIQAPLIEDSTLLIGYIDANLGLGQSLRGLAQALATTAEPFAIYPFTYGVEGRRGAPYMPERYDETGAHAINIIEIAANELPTLFAHIPQDRFDRSYNILRTYWELSRAPEEWRSLLEPIDEIWAPNSFVAESFQSIFDKTITIVPPCVSLPDWEKSPVERFIKYPSWFHFLFSFDYFSFPQRKNPLGVVRAFRRAFPDPSTPVGLIIKSTGAVGHFPEIKQELQSAARHDPRIRVLDEHFSRDEMLSLIEVADCYVSLHRSEGFGLGMVEAMMMGKPVIGTGYSGNAEFVRDDTAFPVDYRLRPLAAGEYVYSEGQVWAEPDEVSSAAQMVRVFNDRADTALRSKAGREFVRERYGPENVSRLATERLAAIRSSRT
ncbi:glycosyltransferase [Aureimonas ureilytica]|uniref:glycosyltransferase n=1 Tax=Aureimonas ureilytica TaxID=401562 RepID=UPI000733F9F3|nr:glycosyltransferase [Aureimonas ureilytica]